MLLIVPGHVSIYSHIQPPGIVLSFLRCLCECACLPCLRSMLQLRRLMSTATTHDLIHTLSDVSLKRTQTTLKQSLARHIPKNTKGDDKYSRHASILLPLCQVIQHRHGRGFDTKSKGHASFLFTVRSLALRNHAGEVSWPGGVFDPLLDIRHDDSEGFYPTSTLSCNRITFTRLCKSKQSNNCFTISAPNC